MATRVRQAQVIYGLIAEKLSRKVTERFIALMAAQDGINVPASPLARYWCRPAPADGWKTLDDGTIAKWMIGWTGPVVERVSDELSVHEAIAPTIADLAKVIDL